MKDEDRREFVTWLRHMADAIEEDDQSDKAKMKRQQEKAAVQIKAGQQGTLLENETLG